MFWVYFLLFSGGVLVFGLAGGFVSRLREIPQQFLLGGGLILTVVGFVSLGVSVLGFFWFLAGVLAVGLGAGRSMRSIYRR